MENNIISVRFDGGNLVYACPRYQYDYGQILKFTDLDLPFAYEVHFSNTDKSGNSVTQIGDENGVTVPDAMFLSGETIYAWVYLHSTADDGETVYKTVIPVQKRAKPTNQTPTPVQQDAITEAIAALDAAVEQTAQDVIDANAAKDAAELAQGKAEDAQSAAEFAQDKAEDAQEASETAQEKAEDAQGASEDARDLAQGYASDAAGSATQAEQAAQSILDLTADASVDANVGTPSVGVSVSEQSGHKNMSFSFHNLKGQPGTDGQDGQDGYSPTVTVTDITGGHRVTVTDAQGQHTFDVMDGEQGEQGEPGQDGTDGFSPVVVVTDITGGHQVSITDAQGTQTFDVMDGEVQFSDLYKAFPHDIANGDLVTISDGADGIPVRDLVVNIEPLQAGSGDPSPSNIRPISGWTGCNLFHTGINVFDGQWERGLINSTTGAEESNNNYYRSVNYIPIVTGESYYLMTNGYTCGCRCYDGSKSYLGNAATNNAVVSYPSGTKYIRFVVASNITRTGFSLNHPSTDHDSHEYVANVYPVSWQTEAGTVYGGTLDVTTGVLTVDRVKKVFDGTESFTRTGGANATTYFAYTLGALNSVKDNNNCICSVWLKAGISSSNIAVGFNVLNSNGFNAALVAFRPAGVYVDGVRMTVAQFQQILADLYSAGTPCEVVYELATPLTFQLSENQISTFLGINNFWSNGNGELSLEYRADTKLYIERLTQPTEDDMTANQNITANTFFMVGNSLFYSTASIAAGEQIVPGTNCTALSLADALNNLNS